MIKAHSGTFVLVLSVIAVGVIVALCLAFSFLQALRRAIENERIRHVQYVKRLSEEWIEGEIGKLESGQTSGVLFYSTSNTDELVNRLSGMAQIKRLTFWTTDLSDNGLSIIGKLPCLEKLTVHGGNSSDHGLQFLSQNRTLKTLHLVNVDLTTKGLFASESIHELENLTIYIGNRSKSVLNDKAVPFLSGLEKLKKLNVGGGWLSQSAIGTLKLALPNCEITENFADDEW
jgi:hypothetical protein